MRLGAVIAQLDLDDLGLILGSWECIIGHSGITAAAQPPDA